MDSFYHNRNIAAALLLACLLLVPLLVYFPVLRSDYVAYDDELLIVDNVKAQGLTWEHVKEAFRTYDPELYIPLTLLTEQIEYTLVGHWSSAVSHGINLALHLLNTVLVFFLMTLLLRSFQVSAFSFQGSFSKKEPATSNEQRTNEVTALFVALLWSVHPLNVEAVAWAAARKDLLSAFFFLGSLCCYLRWRGGVITGSQPIMVRGSQGVMVRCSGASAKEPRIHTPCSHLTMTSYWYWSSIIAFLLGLLSKVSIAPLPFVLLLLEWFPYHPLPVGEGRVRGFRSLLPYFALSAIFVGIALLGKKAQVHALGATLLAPFVAIPFYLQKLFIPTGLSILYPFTEELSLAHPRVLLGLAVLGGLTWIAWWSLRWTRSVVCAFGIFLLLLAPSFLNVARRGDAGMIDLYIASDRYMYLAMLSLLILMACALCGKTWERARVRGLPYCILSGIIVLFTFLSSRQVHVWHDSEALFRNVLLQHQASHIAANNLAGLLAKKGQMAEAMDLYRQSLTIRENPRALFNLGRILISEKRFGDALSLFERYVALKPRDAFGQMQLGGLYLLQGDAARARPHLEKAVARDANLAEAHYLLGVAYERLGDRAKAKREFQETLRRNPDHPHAWGKLGNLL